MSNPKRAALVSDAASWCDRCDWCSSWCAVKGLRPCSLYLVGTTWTKWWKTLSLEGDSYFLLSRPGSTTFRYRSGSARSAFLWSRVSGMPNVKSTTVCDRSFPAGADTATVPGDVCSYGMKPVSLQPASPASTGAARAASATLAYGERRFVLSSKRCTRSVCSRPRMVERVLPRYSSTVASSQRSRGNSRSTLMRSGDRPSSTSMRSDTGPVPRNAHVSMSPRYAMNPMATMEKTPPRFVASMRSGATLRYMSRALPPIVGGSRRKRFRRFDGRARALLDGCAAAAPAGATAARRFSAGGLLAAAPRRPLATRRPRVWLGSGQREA
mmetsp:Transcript_25510/g.78617  ORF Transcript_25510/g.78617 Transcript_25510/m.78617 type:complete len:326 (+) Transcript_25510:181-1158(+)